MGLDLQSPRCAVAWTWRGGDRVIKHIVLLRLLPDYHAAELADVMAGLARLKIAGFQGFAHGPNLDVEKKSTDYPYGFICNFADLDALHHYAADPAHKALGQRLVALCSGGADGIMVADLDL